MHAYIHTQMCTHNYVITAYVRSANCVVNQLSFILTTDRTRLSNSQRSK